MTHLQNSKTVELKAEETKAREAAQTLQMAGFTLERASLQIIV